VKAVEVKEMLYQAVAYLGLSRVYAFFAPTNTIFTNQGISLPLASQKNTKNQTRLEAGEEAENLQTVEALLDQFVVEHLEREERQKQRLAEI